MISFGIFRSSEVSGKFVQLVIFSESKNVNDRRPLMEIFVWATFKLFKLVGNILKREFRKYERIGKRKSGQKAISISCVLILYHSPSSVILQPSKFTISSSSHHWRASSVLSVIFGQFPRCNMFSRGQLLMSKKALSVSNTQCRRSRILKFVQQLQEIFLETELSWHSAVDIFEFSCGMSLRNCFHSKISTMNSPISWRHFFA